LSFLNVVLFVCLNVITAKNLKPFEAETAKKQKFEISHFIEKSNFFSKIF